MKDPTVVISSTPPPTVVCRSAAEASACEALCQILRRGADPICFVVRQKDGTIDVHARSASFVSVANAVDVMKVATIKLTSALFGRGAPLTL